MNYYYVFSILTGTYSSPNAGRYNRKNWRAKSDEGKLLCAPEGWVRDVLLFGTFHNAKA